MFVLITVMCVVMGDGETCRTEIAPLFFHDEALCRNMAGTATISTIKQISKTNLKPTRVSSFCHEMEAQSE